MNFALFIGGINPYKQLDDVICANNREEYIPRIDFYRNFAYNLHFYLLILIHNSRSGMPVSLQMKH